MAIRKVRGYRTISLEAATVLARFPPLNILVDTDARVYDRIHLHQNGESVPFPDSALEALKQQEHQRALTTWRARLRENRYARKCVMEAILPAFEAWMRRKRRVTFRLTLLTVVLGNTCVGLDAK